MLRLYLSDEDAPILLNLLSNRMMALDDQRDSAGAGRLREIDAEYHRIEQLMAKVGAAKANGHRKIPG